MSAELESKIVKLQKELDASAPSWVVTFGDLMSLLLCFFVLLLSFSEMDRAKYKQVAGSLAKAFGVQRKVKAFQAPKGVKMISKDFDQQLIPTHPREEFVAMQKRQEMGKNIKEAVETNFKGMRDLIQIEVGDNEVTIRLMGETAFDSGRAKIKKQMIPLLLQIGTALNDTEGDIVISGHTDNVPIRGGKYRSNLQLSISRAATVAEFLLRRTGIDPKRVSTMGFGKYRPLESNKTADGRKRNRRVEIILRAPEATEKPPPGAGSKIGNPAEEQNPFCKP